MTSRESFIREGKLKRSWLCVSFWASTGSEWSDEFTCDRNKRFEPQDRVQTSHAVSSYRTADEPPCRTQGLTFWAPNDRVQDDSRENVSSAASNTTETQTAAPGPTFNYWWRKRHISVPNTREKKTRRVRTLNSCSDYRIYTDVTDMLLSCRSSKFHYRFIWLFILIDIRISQRPKWRLLISSFVQQHSKRLYIYCKLIFKKLESENIWYVCFKNDLRIQLIINNRWFCVFFWSANPVISSLLQLYTREWPFHRTATNIHLPADSSDDQFSVYKDASQWKYPVSSE